MCKISLRLLVLLFIVSMALIGGCKDKSTEPGLETVATPVFDPPGGTYSSPQTVSISCATPGATIHYTTDGTDPHPGSAVYQTPLQFEQDITIKAMAVRIGWKESSIASVNYTFDVTVASPIISPASGTYAAAQIVEITCETSGATIHYTLDGSEPTEDSTVYNPWSAIVVRDTRTIKAKAFKQGWTQSSTATNTYSIDLAPIEMILVPQGSFTMGDTHGIGAPPELPTHAVSLSSFYMAKYETTQGQWLEVMASWDYDPYDDTLHGVGDNYPIYYVSWEEIIRYCNLRSMMEGLTPAYSVNGSTNPDDWIAIESVTCNWNANGYRLPTEAEWEYAARGATNTPDYLYSGSDDLYSVAWCWNNSNNNSHEVGTKAPNGLGLFDMTGNVNEYCWDNYESGYYSSSPNSNPTGPEGEFYWRVKRGGDWGETDDGPPSTEQPWYYRVSYRGYGHGSQSSIGFRLCRSFQQVMVKSRRHLS